MRERPALDKNLDSKTFRDFYYLKEELVIFCRENGIPFSGGKIEITDRIAYFLNTGNILPAQTARKKAIGFGVLLILNAALFWKRVLPTYTYAFQNAGKDD